MFFWNSLPFSMIQRMLAIWSLVPLPFLKSAWTSESSWFMYCRSLAWRILSITLLACEMSAYMDARVGLWRKPSAKELMLLKCGVGEDSWKSLGLHYEGDQPWDFFGRNDAKAETLVLWPPPVKSWLIGKDSDAGRDWGQEEKRTTKDEMAGWHHRLNGRESEWTPGVGDGPGGLACCNSWGRKESDTTQWLNWTELNWNFTFSPYIILL